MVIVKLHRDLEIQSVGKKQEKVEKHFKGNVLFASS